MKKKLFIGFIILGCLPFLTIKAQEVRDTTFIFNQKKINIQDSISQIKVKVFSLDSTEYKKVYEGIFSDSTTFEKYNVVQSLGIDLPFLKRKRKSYDMKAHWAGFGYSKLFLADSQWGIGENDGVPFDIGKSSEVTFNIIEAIVPVIGKTIGVSTGFGLDWRNYHLKNNTHFYEENGVTIYGSPADITYSYSRLRTLHLTIPAQLEWQPQFGSDKNIFITAGIVGGWNVMSTYRVKYVNSDGDKINKVESRGLSTNPFTLDFIGEVGYNSVSIVAKYSPVGVFQKDKGPNVNAASLGLMLHF